MFGLFRTRAQTEFAAEFLGEMASGVSVGYRTFCQSMAKTLMSHGVPRKPLEALASSSNSAYYYLIGVACEQMQVAVNELGSEGSTINEAIVKQLVRSGMPFGDYETQRAITEIMAAIRAFPANSRVVITSALFSRQGFVTMEVLQALRDPVTQGLINATISVDCLSGIMKTVLARRGLVEVS